MSRWLIVGAIVVGGLLLGVVAASPLLHADGDADCPGIDGDPAEADHGTHESDMYAGGDEGGAYGDCPIDDGAGMGAPAAIGATLR